MKKTLLTLAAFAAFLAADAQQTYNYFDPADCDAEGWLWFDTQEKLDKYVGWQEYFEENLEANPKIMLQTAEFENADMGFDEPYLDPDIKGFDVDHVQGGDGAWTGAIVLCGSKNSTGSDSPNGGGIMLHLPDLAEFGLKLSTVSDYMCLGLKGAKGWVEPVDCGVVQTYYRMGILVKKELSDSGQFTWNNIQEVTNANTNLQLASPAGEKVTALVRNNRGDELLVHAIKVFTYTDNGVSGVCGVEAGDNAPVEYYNLQGMKVNGGQPGIYVRRQGVKTSKVIVK